MRQEVKPVRNLLLDMPVRWSSTYIMTTRAEEMRDIWNAMISTDRKDVTDISFKVVDVFVYEIGQDERDHTKRQKIDNLALSPVEWERVKLFNDLLAVCH